MAIRPWGTLVGTSWVLEDPWPTPLGYHPTLIMSNFTTRFYYFCGLFLV